VSAGFFLARTRITWHIEAVAVKTDVTQVFLRLLISKSVSAPSHMVINAPHTLPYQQEGEHLWSTLSGHFFLITLG